MAAGRLLVLDDDATVGQILVIGAAGAGFEARLCLQADEFFAMLATWDPTHVALDLSLPDITPPQLMRRLCASGCRARVLIVSGAGRAELDEALNDARALGLDAPGALPKPFSMAVLRSLLRGET
jgi:DNA-binding response OmpR family regulator